MSLQTKYAELLNQANGLGITNLAVAEQEGVLHLSGTVKSTADYDTLWATYNTIDPDKIGRAHV